MKREVEIFDMLPSEVMKKLDEDGYSLLRAHGYDTSGAAKSYKRRARLKTAMKKRGEELRYCSAVERESKSILIWFELYKGEERIAKSRGIKIMCKETEGGTYGEGNNGSEN